jgi:hypothetical protein
MAILPPIDNAWESQSKDWLDKEDLKAILPDYIVDQILRGAYHSDFSGNPVIPASELEDLVGLVLRDRNTTEGNA